MNLSHSPNLTKLSPEARKVLVHIVRELCKVQLWEQVRENGLEKTEELVLESISNGSMKLCCDRNGTEAIYWLEKVEVLND